MRSYIILLIFLSTFSAHSQNKVQEKLTQLVKNPHLENATVAFFAIDLDSGDTIGKWNHKTSQPSASNAKLFSTYTALELLGSNYQPKTRLYLEGNISNEGILNGNLWIRGGGDVSMASKYFSSAGNEFSFIKKWADTLKKLGIKEIAGSIITDGSEFGYEGAPDGWEWSDHSETYGAHPSGICFNDNVMNYFFKSGSVGTNATLTHTYPSIPEIKFHSHIKVSHSASGITLYGGPYSINRYGKGSIPPNQAGYAIKSAMVNPEFQFAIILKEYLSKQGVRINSFKSVHESNLSTPNYNSMRLIYMHNGVSLIEIITKTNMHSINFFAEGLVNLIGFEKTGVGTTASGINQMDSFWRRKINTKGLFINDGSGLSRSNSMSPSHYVEMLKYIYKSKNYSTFLSSLPVAGVSGTLGKVCAGQAGQGRIKAKSGTLTRVKAYSGYVNSKSGKNIAFSFSINNFTCAKSEIVSIMEPVMNAMADY